MTKNNRNAVQPQPQRPGLPAPNAATGPGHEHALSGGFCRQRLQNRLTSIGGLAFMACSSMVSFALSHAHAAGKPNVVILFTDDQGTLDANCYGSTDLITPNIDRLAATGVRFTQAYAHTVCCPARAALMTGRHPQRGGVHHWTQGDMNAAEGHQHGASKRSPWPRP